jgi:SAM-dependent methyltransferase
MKDDPFAATHLSRSRVDPQMPASPGFAIAFRWMAPLKPWLVPFWNTLAHRARASTEYVSALLHRRIENCTVCGRHALMILRPRVIPDRLAQLWQLTPRQRAALARKESLDCSHCGAKLRARRLARVLLDLYADPIHPSTSIAEWVKSPSAQQLAIAEINKIDGLHAQLATLPRLAFSDYQADPSTGTPHEDLQALSYSGDSFDLVLTSETLEHVPDLARALVEIHRVLRPGGRHIFTIPVLATTPNTFPRGRLRPDGSVELLAPAISHPGGDSGYPVFTEFGLDAADGFSSAGFETTVHFGPATDDDLAQVYVCRRPTLPPTGARTNNAEGSTR